MFYKQPYSKEVIVKSLGDKKEIYGGIQDESVIFIV